MAWHYFSPGVARLDGEALQVPEEHREKKRNLRHMECGVNWFWGGGGGAAERSEHDCGVFVMWLRYVWDVIVVGLRGICDVIAMRL